MVKNLEKYRVCGCGEKRGEIKRNFSFTKEKICHMKKSEGEEREKSRVTSRLHKIFDKVHEER